MWSRDQRHHFEDAPQGALVGAADSQHQAELGGAHRLGLPGRGEHLVVVEKRHRLHRRVEAGGLGAEVAVFGTSAGLGRQDALDLHGRAPPGQTDLMGEGGQGRHGVVRHRSQRRQLVGIEAAAVVQQGDGGMVEERPVGRTGHRPSLT